MVNMRVQPAAFRRGQRLGKMGGPLVVMEDVAAHQAFLAALCCGVGNIALPSAIGSTHRFARRLSVPHLLEPNVRKKPARPMRPEFVQERIKSDRARGNFPGSRNGNRPSGSFLQAVGDEIRRSVIWRPNLSVKVLRGDPKGTKTLFADGIGSGQKICIFPVDWPPFPSAVSTIHPSGTAAGPFPPEPFVPSRLGRLLPLPAHGNVSPAWLSEGRSNTTILNGPSEKTFESQRTLWERWRTPCGTPPLWVFTAEV